jgi:hypothetical protein
VDSLFSGTADRMRILGVDPEQLPGLNAVAQVRILDYVPLVAKP